MTNEDFLSYLRESSIELEDKKYVSNFFNKKKYIDTLNKTAIGFISDGSTLSSGTGNYNSKIAIIIENRTDLDYVKRFAEPLFNYMHTSLWNMYITFHNKSDMIQPSVYHDLLLHEIGAVNPELIIYFSDNVSFFEEIFNTTKSQIRTVHFNIDDVKYVLDKDNFKSERYCDFMEKVYQFIVTIIPLREIEILE